MAIVSSPSPSTHQQYNYLTGIAEISPTDLWVVGYTQKSAEPSFVPLIEHYDGNAWAMVSSPFSPSSETNQLLAVAGTSADDVWAVGYGASTGQSEGLIQHWNGTQWSLIDNPVVAHFAVDLYGIAAVSKNDVWAVGYLWSLTRVLPLTEHWDGSKWSVVNPPDPGNAAELFGAGTVAGTVWAVGAYSPVAGNGLDPELALTLRR